MELNKHNWFEIWFNTPYYHLLYNHRSYDEADQFISNLMRHLHLNPNCRIWDLACGKGRHSIALNKLGFDVTGTDLSEESIKEALKSESDRLHFYRLDMRSLFRTNYFDLVLNLFTSFGYFENPNDDLKVFKSVSNSLKPNGTFVFDYLNKDFVIKNLQCLHEIEKDGVKFIINKELQNNSVVKHIKVLDNGKEFSFCESVKLYGVDEIVALANKVGLKKVDLFGSYDLVKNNEDSNRTILIFKKD